VPVPELRAPAGVHIRPMLAGEEPRVLDALNRNWADTWGFTPIRSEMLEHDLDGQRAGMLLGVDAVDDGRILATCHAVFDETDRNPDGDPRAWISNLTVDPDARGRGLGRALLLAGLRFLRDRGAGSITLGVDADDPPPLRLYESVGFQPMSGLRMWDKTLHG
jgi:mycothiol synthase